MLGSKPSGAPRSRQKHRSDRMFGERTERFELRSPTVAQSRTVASTTHTRGSGSLGDQVRRLTQQSLMRWGVLRPARASSSRVRSCPLVDRFGLGCCVAYAVSPTRPCSVRQLIMWNTTADLSGLVEVQAVSGDDVEQVVDASGPAGCRTPGGRWRRGASRDLRRSGRARSARRSGRR